jgi:signal transduction histidine kinase/ActR/RegA family two-component response regulator
MKQREWFNEQPHVRRMGELMQLSARRADGSEVPVEVSLTPIGTGPGMRVIAIIRDASDRQLFQQVSDERRLLAEQVERVVRLEAVGRLAGGVAHDFNNMLTVVSGYTDALLHDDLDAATERLMLEGIRTATDRAAALTRQLLAFGRKQVLQPKVVDLTAVLTSMRGMLARLVGESIQLVITSAPDVKAVTIDPTQMEQVIMNLVMNARNAMVDGGAMTIETNNVNLVEPLPLPWSADVAPVGVYVMLSVRDEGVGMSRETVARAFEPFFTTRDPGKGTGLGLSTVHGIVKQSGGYVWIDSKPGIGTAVYLLLPQSDEAVAVGTPVEHTALPHGSGTVLLVEDEPEVRELLVQTLSHAGYTVVAAANGRAALEAFEAAGQPIDIIVTDVVMPETSGHALVRAARARRPDLKVLFISGYADEGATGEMVQDASTRYLQKPFNRNQLLRGIAELLGGPPVR